MRKKRPGGCLGFGAITLALIIGFVSWAEFLFKPVARALDFPDRGLWWLFGDLLALRSQTYGTPLLGYLFLLASLLLLVSAILAISRPVRWFLDYLDIAEAPVSILETRIKLRMLDTHHVGSEVHRNQTIHANRSDVHAYHHTMSVNTGTIVSGSWRFESQIDGKVITLDPLIHATSSKLEVIERFLEPLPTSYRVTYLPNNIVLALNAVKHMRIFNKVLVTRQTWVRNENEYNGPEPIFQLRSVRYPATNVAMSVEFPSSTAPETSEIECFLITENVARSIPIKNEDIKNGSVRVYSAEISSLRRDQALRIQWKNDRLNAAIANGLALTQL